MTRFSEQIESHRFGIVGTVQECTNSFLKAFLPGTAIGQRVQIQSQCGFVSGIVTSYNNQLSTIVSVDGNQGIRPGAKVRVLRGELSLNIPYTPLGLALSASGEVIAGSCGDNSTRLIIEKRKIQLRSRSPKLEKFKTGVPAIDSLFSLARGQRLLVSAEPGVGKTRLLTALARGSEAEIIILALVGERGREAREFISNRLTSEIRKKSVIVISTSDEPAMKRVQSGELACSLAEHYAKEGKKVLLLFDSLTRYVRAQRDVALASGELPVRRGYPASVFAKLPQLLERAGNFRTGSITAFFTMLLNSELDEDPMIEEAKGILDGHLVLRRKIAERGVYPALSISESLSRLAGDVQSKKEKDDAAKLKKLFSRLETDRELSLFADRLDPELDFALKNESQLYDFVKGEIGIEKVLALLGSS